ncbi:MAG: amidohydrolase family protein [Candidatus Poribacteria bacterium]|nr:amidohydrolase family protein [Candidatus Poribacteria bacterium]
MIIDTHVHVWKIDPPKYPVGPTAPGWNSYPDEPGTADELLAEMDMHEVDWAVLVQTSWSTWDNGYIADSVARFPNRFIGQGLIDPQDPENAELVRYWIKERGLVGFRFHPMYYPDEKILLTQQNTAMWEEIAAIDAIIQFHLRAEFADQVATIARQYPDLKLILDHMGYPQVNTDQSSFQPIVDLAEFDNIYLKLSDVAGRSHQDFPYVDVHPFIEKLLSAFGSERTVWGTGYPGHHREKHNWPTLDQELRLIREGLPFLTDMDKENILGTTAMKIWNLSGQ